MRVRVRSRVRSRTRRKKKYQPTSERECLEIAAVKGLSAWDLLKFLYDCIKRAKR